MNNTRYNQNNPMPEEMFDLLKKVADLVVRSDEQWCEERPAPTGNRATATRRAWWDERQRLFALRVESIYNPAMREIGGVSYAAFWDYVIFGDSNATADGAVGATA